MKEENTEKELSHKKKGLIIVITGHGKGKTTSAVGLALRSAGHGLKVCIIQFMKGNVSSGEIKALQKIAPEVDLHVFGKGFFEIMGDTHTTEEHKKSAEDALELARKKIRSGNYDVIILDEINIALKLGLLDLQYVLDTMNSRPSSLHLILTGRDAHKKIIDLADTVTEMIEIKHPYTGGAGPVRGIDY